MPEVLHRVMEMDAVIAVVVGVGGRASKQPPWDNCQDERA